MKIKVNYLAKSLKQLINTALLILLCAASYNVSAQTLRVGLMEYPPHIDFDEENDKSPLFQYVRSMLLPLGFQLEFIRFPGKRGSIELAKGNIDLLLPLDDDKRNFNPLFEPTFKLLSSPIFHSMPGLCFKKENFIPILSATHRFTELLVGVPIGSSIVEPLKNSQALLVDLKGNDAISRGIDLTQRGRLDAFYHPSPIKVYHRKNKLYKEVACSYFHGYSTGEFVAVSPLIAEDKFAMIEQAYQKAMKEQSYEYYFAKVVGSKN